MPKLPTNPTDGDAWERYGEAMEKWGDAHQNMGNEMDQAFNDSLFQFSLHHDLHSLNDAKVKSGSSSRVCSSPFEAISRKHKREILNLR